MSALTRSIGALEKQAAKARDKLAGVKHLEREVAAINEAIAALRKVQAPPATNGRAGKGARGARAVGVLALLALGGASCAVFEPAVCVELRTDTVSVGPDVRAVRETCTWWEALNTPGRCWDEQGDPVPCSGR